MSRKFISIISVITVLVFLLFFLFSKESGCKRHKELDLQIKQLDENIANAKNQINNTYTYEQLENDTSGILEKYAREQLNLQKPDEDVFVIMYE